MANSAENVRSKLYDSYVSSGQVGTTIKSEDTEKAFSSKKVYANYIIKNYFPANKGAKILDLGCGHGAYIYHIKEAGYVNIIGIDTSQEQVEIANRFGLSEVMLGDIEEYINNIEPGEYEIVLLMDVIEHLTTSENINLLEKIRSKIKPHGKVFIHVPNAEGLFGMRVRYGDLTHETAFTPTSIRQLLMLTGFSIFKVIEDKPIVHGFTSFIRRIIWNVFTFKYRLMLAAETGNVKAVLSQNMLIVAQH
jgi:2-polyprenyl-3-methyl-5-hydroxy-6-metoxy-1,4-benzoquinol methylase